MPAVALTARGPANFRMKFLPGIRGAKGDKPTMAEIAAYLATLPDSDAGLNTGDLFWNGDFLARKSAS